MEKPKGSRSGLNLGSSLDQVPESLILHNPIPTIHNPQTKMEKPKGLRLDSRSDSDLV